MSVVFWNCANGLVPKLDFVEFYLNSIKPELMFVFESELKKDMDYSCLAIPRYDLHISKTLCWGKARMVTYIKSDSKFKRCENLEDGESELMVYTNNKVIISGVYRPFKTVNNHTQGSAFDKLLTSLDNVTKHHTELIIGGDFNVNWESSSCKKDALEEWCERSGLEQLVSGSTRRREVKKVDGEKYLQSSCLDLVFASSPVRTKIMPSASSDHDIVEVLFENHQSPKSMTKKVTTVDWRKYSPLKAAQLLSNLPFSISDEPKALFDNIMANLYKVLNTVAPKRVIKIRDQHEFVNCEITAIKKKRDRAWKIYKKFNSEKHMLKARQLTKELKKTIISEKKRVFRAKLNSHGAQSFWNTIGNVFNINSVKNTLELKIDGEVTSDEGKIAEEFSKFFDTKIKRLISGTSVNASIYPARCDELWEPFSENEISDALKGIKNKKSCGLDELPMCFIKDCSMVLVSPLTRLFNGCVRTGWFPPDWKVAKITPIHKKGKKDCVENYRPVSGLPTISKVFEKCLLKRLNLYQGDDVAQHGFRSDHSTVTACLDVQSKIAQALDKKLCTAIYTMDMSAAFDMLRKELLVLNVPKPLEAIIKDFLSDRRAQVVIGSECSTLKTIDIGVPQGSVLGPKLFSYYTADLRAKMESDDVKVVAYADDAFVVCSAADEESLRELCELKMNEHLTWLRSIGMVVNPSKTELMYFNKDRVLTVQCDGNSIRSSDSMRVLGIWFDKDLNWERHLQTVVANCRRIRPALRTLKKKLNTNELLQVVTSHYYSRLYYGCEVWYNCLKQNLKNKIAAVHYFPLRLSLNDFRRSMSYKQLSTRCKRASPQELVDFRVAKIVVSICNNADPFTLFQDLLANAHYSNRLPLRPNFFDYSRLRIGRQSLQNRVSNIMSRLNFDWLDPMSPEALRFKLKKCFFEYLN